MECLGNQGGTILTKTLDVVSNQSGIESFKLYNCSFMSIISQFSWVGGLRYHTIFNWYSHENNVVYMK